MNDLIDRQQAIDIERNATVDTNPSHFEAHQKFTQFMDDAEISSFGRWQWSNGFNTALTAVGIDLKKLPSAQPEIVRCKNCQYLLPQEDAVSRKAMIDALEKYFDGLPIQVRYDLIEITKKLPSVISARPEIIRCRECKFASGDSRICMKFDHSPIGELDFCSWAEKREENNESN